MRAKGEKSSSYEWLSISKCISCFSEGLSIYQWRTLNTETSRFLLYLLQNSKVNQNIYLLSIFQKHVIIVLFV